MNPPSSNKRTWDQRFRQWSRERPLPAAISLVAVPALLGVVLVALPVAGGDWDKALITAILTLVFGGLIGGTLKILLEDFAATQQQREANVQFVQNLLADLKSVYDRVERARILINAHRSAKTYGNEIRDLIDAQVQLKNVNRALSTQAEGIDDERRQTVEAEVGKMLSYLVELTDEFQKKYKRLSDKQRVYEAEIAIASARATKGGLDDAEIRRAVESSDVWMDLTEWDQAKHFLGHDEQRMDYRDQFESPLDKASRLLREQLTNLR